MHRYPRREIGLSATAAQERAHATGFAGQHRLNRVVHAAQVGHLDLDHVGGLGVHEGADVVQGVGPLVGHQLHLHFAETDVLAQRLHGLDLCFLALHEDRTLHPQGVGLHSILQGV